MTYSVRHVGTQGVKKLVDDVEDLRRENHAFLVVRKKFNKS